ncbi:MAG TPA: hypothetical protein DCE41_17705 [Cytophagales bacterium]|nr:hypothetical protein [Cytophagales bacterium]HAA23696.1 hypothetical protein [Cytophagales bacterium]HAP62866.1 hypothetical protein [Cytophagales bacterium]
MDWQRIETLVEKYWEGETSLEEESELRTALQKPDVPAALQREAELMGFWTAEHAVSLSTVRDYAMRRVHLTTRDESSPREAKTVKINPLWMRVAATVVIGVALYVWNAQGDSSQDPLTALVSLGGEVSPEETYDEVRDALLFISMKMKQGTDPIDNLKELQQVQQPLDRLQELQKAQNPLDQLQKFNRADEILKERNN